jgi:hypothetical protein
VHLVLHWPAFTSVIVAVPVQLRTSRIGQNRVFTPYMTVHLVISLPKKRIYTVYIWFWQTLHIRCGSKRFKGVAHFGLRLLALLLLTAQVWCSCSVSAKMIRDQRSREPWAVSSGVASSTSSTDVR